MRLLSILPFLFLFSCTVAEYPGYVDVDMQEYDNGSRSIESLFNYAEYEINIRKEDMSSSEHAYVLKGLRSLREHYENIKSLKHFADIESLKEIYKELREFIWYIKRNYKQHLPKLAKEKMHTCAHL